MAKKLPQKIKMKDANSGEEVEVVPLNDIKPDPLLSKDRLTATLMIHHQHHGHDAVSADPRFSDFLETFDVEPARRRLRKITTEWQPITFGEMELEHVGTFVFQNMAGQRLNVLPTDEQRAFFQTQIIRVKRKGETLEILVRPGRFSGPVEFEDAKDLVIKCDYGECEGFMWVFPK